MARGATDLIIAAYRIVIKAEILPCPCQTAGQGVTDPPTEEISSIPAPTFSQATAGVPGVIVQEFFGSNDQPRFQIRGSGMQQSPTERGLLILQNGMPVNLADGSYIAGLAAPGMAESIEIWRGASANRLGASVLGGAVNFISPTADTAPGTKLSFGGGSNGTISASGQTAIQGENIGTNLETERAEHHLAVCIS